MKRKAVTLQLEGEIPQPQSAYDAAVEDGYLGSEEQYGKELATIPPTQEQFDAIPGRISKLTTTTEKSDFHHITDSAADRVVEFGMEGKTEQNTTRGVNLYTGEDVEFTGSHAILYMNFPAGTYTFSAIVDSTDTDYSKCLTTFGNIERGKTTRTSVTKTFTEDITTLRFYSSQASAAGSGDTASFKDIQIELGSTATDYEPYTNGPSPNPDYPQEIVNAGVYNEATGKYEIGCVVAAKNWFDERNLSNGEFVEFDGVRCYKYIDDAKNFTCQGLFLENTRYTIKTKIFRESGVTHNTTIVVHYTDGTSGAISCRPSVEQIHSTNTDKTIKCITGGYNHGQTVYLDLSVTQIELGSTATDYVVGGNQQFTLTSPVPLTKWDYLTKRDGVWGWSIQAKEYNLSADECTSISANNLNDTTSRMYINNIIGKKYGDCLCEIFPHHYMWHTGNFPDSGFFYGETFCIQMLNNFLEPYGYTYDESDYEASRINVVNALLELIRAHDGIRVWVDMQEEQSFHPLPDEEQTLLNNLETYYGVTNLYNDQGCPMWLSYVQDTKTAVDNKFENIKNAIISLGGNV